MDQAVDLTLSTLERRTTEYWSPKGGDSGDMKGWDGSGSLKGSDRARETFPAMLSPAKA